MSLYQYFRPDELRNFMTSFFQHFKVPIDDAQIASEILLSADLRGVDSHGIIRLNSYYGARLKRGLVNPLSPLTIIREKTTTLALDGGSGLGLVVGYHAMQKTIEKALQTGVALCTVRNSNHFGIAGYYAMMALQHDLIGISLTNTQPLVTPTYGKQPLLGTNPIAVAVPAGKETPFVLDMATSIVPIGRVTVYEKSERSIPAGWGADSTGKVTTDPSAVLHGGSLLPLGGTAEMRGYKGYGLALLVDILSGVLAGSAFADDVAKPGGDSVANVGHFFAAFRIDAFRSVEEFKKDMDNLISRIKSSPKAEGEERIFIHGEKEFEMAARNEREGVPLLNNVVQQLKDAGAEINVPFFPQPIREEEISE